jgi:hypothetical protein
MSIPADVVHLTDASGRSGEIFGDRRSDAVRGRDSALQRRIDQIVASEVEPTAFGAQLALNALEARDRAITPNVETRQRARDTI